jgi:PST family polysaccharide transporter/lipopolysaccharide exporter
MKKILTRLPGYPIVDSIFSTATFRQSSITFGGTAISGALGAVFYILTARFLGPAAFGLLNVAIVTLTLVADIGDLGTDTGLVNFIPKYIKQAPEKAKRFLKLGLEIKLVVGLVVALAGLFLAPYLAVNIFDKSELTTPLAIAFIGVAGLLLFSYVIHSLQAFQKFWAWSGVQVGANTLRIILIIGFVILGKLTTSNTLIIYIAMPVIGFVFGTFLIPVKFWKVKKEFSVAKEFFKYNKWIAALTLASAFGSRLDTFISARLLDTTDLGIYSAANQLIKIVPQIVVALGTVIAPKMSEMDSIKDFVVYLKKTQLMVSGIVLLGLLSIPIVLYLIPIIFGASYTGVGPIFIILFLAMLIFLLSVPLHTAVFYYFSYPKLFFWQSLIHLIIIAILGWYLISSYSVVGAAVTVLVGQIFNFMVPAYYVVAKIRKPK